MAEEAKTTSKRKWIDRLVTALIILFVLFDVYAVSFFLLLKPRHDLYQIEKEDGVEYITKYGHPDSYLLKTFACISDDEKINTAGYYFYWPIHRPLSYMNHFQYVVDPDWHKLKVERYIRRRDQD